MPTINMFELWKKGQNCLDPWMLATFTCLPVLLSHAPGDTSSMQIETCQALLVTLPEETLQL